MEAGSVVFGRYQLHEQIGAGGFGVVWRATDLRLDQPVALKFMTFDEVGDGQVQVIRDRALREARLAAQLRGHPNVVLVYDVLGAEGNEVCIVMEFLPARSLSELLTSHSRLDIARVARIGAGIANALAAAHDRGIEHRDVKPGNILICDDDTVKLTDFGVSHFTGDPERTQRGVRGTPAYLAPEVVERRQFSPAADMYSLGATLYAALEGRPPFGIMLEPVNAGPLEPVLSRLLLLNPDVRPDAATTRDTLRAVVTQLSGAEEPVPAPTRARPVWWRPLWRTALVAGLLAAVIGTVIVVVNPFGGTPSLGPVTKDIRGADPCPLIGVRALDPYGWVRISRVPGILEGCEAEIKTDAGLIHLRVNFDNPQPASAYPGAKTTIDNVTLVATRPVDSYEGAPDCENHIVAAGAPLIAINVYSHEQRDQGVLCKVADSAANAAIGELRKRGGRIPIDKNRIAPYLLARNDACETLDKLTLDKIVGLDSNEPQAGFANWSCTWGTKESAATVKVQFRMRESFQGLGGDPVPIAGKDAYRVGDRGYCDVYVFVGQPDIPGEQVNETLHLTVVAPLPKDEVCELTGTLAAAAVRSLHN